MYRTKTLKATIVEDLLLQWKIEKEERGSRPPQVVCTSIHMEICLE